jgi:rubrerythrin
MVNTTLAGERRFQEERRREAERRQAVESRMRDQVANPHVPRCENPACRAERNQSDDACPSCGYPY